MNCHAPLGQGHAHMSGRRARPHSIDAEFMNRYESLGLSSPMQSLVGLQTQTHQSQPLVNNR